MTFWTAVFLVQSLLFLGSAIDDTWIFARYARHLLRYGDVVWNPGEARIEGFSSWPWLAVYAAAERFDLDPVLVAKLVGMALGAALVTHFSFVVLRDRGHRLAGNASAAILASPSLAYYASSGMDHIAWAMAVWMYIVWVCTAEEPRPRHFVVAGLGVLMRPEGFLLFVPALALMASSFLLAGKGARSLASSAWTVAPGLAVMGALLLLRFALFGRWLPNAAAAKHYGGSLMVALVEGSVYLARGFADWAAIPAVVAAVVAGTAGLGGTRAAGIGEGAGAVGRRIALASVAFSVVLCAFVLVAGGDDTSAFGSTRLLTPAFAPAAFVLFCVLRPVTSRRAVPALMGVVLVAFVMRVPNALDLLRNATGSTNLSTPADVLLAWRRALEPSPLTPISKYLLDHTPSGAFVAVPWAGLVPYQTDLPTIDMLGLNDRHVAAASNTGRSGRGSRYDAEYVLRRGPYFICENFTVRQPLASLRALSDAELRAMGAFKSGQRDLLRNPLLEEQYEIALDAPTDGTCFRRKS
ncbi:MAG TPA: hypothetical protein VMW19_06785 [Myxococcota bacterium]|nr:hypothetical protein [Myxococcota bacterium]